MGEVSTCTFPVCLALRSVVRRKSPSIYTSFYEIGFTFRQSLRTLGARRSCSWPQQALCDWCPRSYTEPLERATRIVPNKGTEQFSWGKFGRHAANRYFSRGLCSGLVLCFGGGSDALADRRPAQKRPPRRSPLRATRRRRSQQSFLSSLKQAFNKDFRSEVVRGHFRPRFTPNVHRYYCLVDPRPARRSPMEFWVSRSRWRMGGRPSRRVLSLSNRL